jgi:hypothetical protein
MRTITPVTLRESLARLALGSDDRAYALTLLFLLRAVAAEEGVVVELSASEDKTLVTIDEPASELWIAEVLPISMATIESVLALSPELSIAFLRFTQGAEVIVRARKPHAAAAYIVHETPVELPPMDLLLAAGLVPRRSVSAD